MKVCLLTGDCVWNLDKIKVAYEVIAGKEAGDSYTMYLRYASMSFHSLEYMNPSITSSLDVSTI